MFLATAREWPDAGAWALEPKWDGYRMLAAVDDGRARCWSRHHTELTSAVGDVLVEVRELLPDTTLVDGGLVALNAAANGDVDPDFNRVAPRRLDPSVSSRGPGWLTYAPDLL